MMLAMEVRKSIYVSISRPSIMLFCVFSFLARPLFVESLSCVHLLQGSHEANTRLRSSSRVAHSSLIAHVNFAVAIIGISYTLSPHF